MKGVAWLPIAALLIAAGFLAVAWSQGQADEQTHQAQRASTLARAVSWVWVQEDMSEIDESEGQTQRFVTALVEKLPDVSSALVLKGVKIKAHHDAEKVDTRLDPESLTAKALYDDARRLKANVGKNVDERQKTPDLTYDPYAELEIKRVDGAFQALAVADDHGQYAGAAQVVMTPQPFPVSLPWIILLIALGISVVWIAAAGRLPAGARKAVGVVLLLGLAVASTMVLPDWRAETRQQQITAEAELLGVLWGLGLDKSTAVYDQEEWEDLDDDEKAEEQARIDANALVPYLDRTPGGLERDWLTAIAPKADAKAGDGQQAIESGAIVAAYAIGSLVAAEAEDLSNVRLWAIGFALVGLLFFLLGEFKQLTRAGRAAVKHRGAYAYLSPAMLGMLILVFVPVVFGVVLGFTQRTYNVTEFAGLANYIEILGDFEFSDPRNFYFKLGVTLMWTILNVGLHVSIGLFLAILLNDQMLKAKGIYRVILIVPWAIPNYITALIWKGMFNKQFGAVNAFIEMMGGESISWFQGFWSAFSTNLITNTWLGFPFMMVVCLGALQSIPSDLYEAAWVDGANRWQRFRQITLPLLMPALVPAVIVGTVWTFNMFNIIYLVSGGAPNGATDILITDAFRWAFERDRYGFAAAYSTVIFLILLGFTLLTDRFTGATKGAFE